MSCFCCRTMGDKLGEAKSSGNLGNTLKVMGKFDEAMICCKRHLEISRELKDKVHMVLCVPYCTSRL
jgi:Tetratricopeptide repeat.